MNLASFLNPFLDNDLVDASLLSGKRYPAFNSTLYSIPAGSVALSDAAIVDTSSGVEDAPGRKNVDKIAAFLGAVAEIR